MNIYSLEYFEQTLPVEKIRPPYRKPDADGPRLAALDVEQPAWDGAPVFAPDEMALLAPRPTRGEGFHSAEIFLQRLGMQTQGGCRCAGVLLDADAVDPAEFSVWRRAFDGAPLIARADRPEQIAALRAAGLPFGLLLDARAGTLPVRRRLAEQGLQFVWQSAPVFLLAKGCPDGDAALKQAMDGWHVLAADVPGAVPGALLVRRVTYPKALSSGGALPLRLWLQNVGNTPVYAASQMQLRLKTPEGSLPVPVRLAPRVWPVGDTVYNEITQLPGVAPGRYELQCRVWRENGGGAVPLGGESDGDGWLALGTAVLDGTPRPELYTAWDTYYPDGYYPLEDPKLPG